ncbi:prolipoprotein diacylglyceryl transferase [Jatrophihabitans fulvus]
MAPDPAVVLASIPSPTRSVWHLGPLPVRAYALAIILGIVVAIWVTTRRWRERHGDPDHVWDVAGWAIVFGIIGGRLYHVLTDPEIYFGDNGKGAVAALKVWDGGLGIWGAIALGAVGAWIGCRRRGIKLVVFADAAVPGVIFAQALGRIGNWFNNELYGARTDLPWGLKIREMDLATGEAGRYLGTFQPTFLYELVWNVAVGVALILLDRRFRLGRGNVAALYVMGYTLGRVWIEMLRTDTANHILGVRLNVWTSIIVFALGLAWFVRHGGFRAEREPSPYVTKPIPRESSGSGEDAGEGDTSPDSDSTSDVAVEEEVRTDGPADDRSG